MRSRASVRDSLRASRTVGDGDDNEACARTISGFIERVRANVNSFRA